MQKSGDIKAEIDRLSSDVRTKEASLQQKRTSASSFYEHINQNVSEFFNVEKTKVDQTKKEQTVAARSIFAQKYSTLKRTIEDNKGLTYEPWDSAAWAAFDIERQRPAHNLTRLGSFEVKGRNGEIQVPATFPILGGKNVLLRATGAGRRKARDFLRNICFRLLASLPPGKLRFSFIDPVELGSTAAGLVGTLPDFLTGKLAWHEEQDIQEQLSLIETRIASIKTKCLGVNYSSIEQYNADPKTIKESYWLLIVSDCPIRFRDDSIQRLLSIAKNGPKAGVYLAVMLDDSQKKCTDALVCELAETAHHIVFPDYEDPVFFDDPDFRQVSFIVDPPPPPKLIEHITGQVAKTAALAQDVKVEWEAPASDAWWKSDSRYGLSIPLGTFGARKPQLFEIDEKLLNSALIIGKPGSGKSRLLHVLINGLTTRYSPDELALYLLDCKQVEFKDYATHKLPHARVVAIESEREFGLSVLRRLNAELDSRKTEFSSAGETALSSYRNKTGKTIPRILLIVDEFQELLNSDDSLAREAASILDRLVRQGRALGINIILASQTLAGQSSLQASTKNQIPIRIVLQCSESDSISALSQENDEARLLERPGEAIYNSANGRREGNNRFQVSWLSDEKLETLLIHINAHGERTGYRFEKAPVIFDGNSLADIRQNRTLKEYLRAAGPSKIVSDTFFWLGEPIEMKDSTAAVFRRQSRSNLLIIGQNEYEQACVSMMMAGLVSIAAQRDSETSEFVMLNLTDPSAEWSQLPSLCKEVLPHQIQVLQKSQLSEKLIELNALIEKRSAENLPSPNTSIYFFIIGLHRDRSLRRTESSGFMKGSLASPVPKAPSPAELLSKICREGSVYGIHCAVWCDTFSNFDRVFQRNDVDEFSLRVALQMSESDSRSLIDSDAANRIGGHRAIFFDDEKHGRLEKFRPYSLIDAAWLREVGERLGK